ATISGEGGRCGDDSPEAAQSGGVSGTAGVGSGAAAIRGSPGGFVPLVGGVAPGCADGSMIASTFQSAPTMSISAWRRISSLPPLANDSRGPALLKPGGSHV